ncbi:MAG: exonuclease SbcCD subunit D [Chloroflexi bacterium]|nr:exonuclease SbcCD subunit D [Chloroflexota bacterium]
MTINEPIRLLHFADIHIGMENFGQIDPSTGVNQRVLDFVRRMSEIVDYALEHSADIVVFCGDAFKTRDPSPTYQREFARQIMRLTRENIPTVLLVGNHDMPIMDKRASSVDIFRTLSVPNVIVGHKEELHRVETKRGVIQVATAPWPIRSRLLQYDEHRNMSIDELDQVLEQIVADELERLASEVDPSLPAILAGHFTVAGSKYGSERSVMIGRDAVIKLGALNKPVWDYVALGHIHKHQDVNAGQLPPVVYSGNLERIDFGEEREAKGFCWVEIKRGETQWQFIPVTARPFVTIEVDATMDGQTPTEAALRAIERNAHQDAVVRVRVKLLQSQESLFKPKEVEKALKDARFIVGISKDVQRDVRSRIGIEKAESLTPPELLRQYLVSKNTPPSHIDELLALAKGFLEKRDS